MAKPKQDVLVEELEYGGLHVWVSNPKRQFVEIKEIEGNDHLSKGSGCPSCARSTGEEIVARSLTELRLDFICQAKFEGCKNIHKLPFDFHIKYNTKDFLIEFDGEHHYHENRFFGGEKAFEKRRFLDNIKTEFARMNGFVLIRLRKYHLKNIAHILKKEIGII